MTATSGRAGAGVDAPSRTLGAIALALAVVTAIASVGMLALAAFLYAPIAGPTSISAGEGRSLTPSQEHLSAIVAGLKAAAVPAALLFGVLTLPFATAAIGLGRGRRFGVAAAAILLAAAIGSAVLLLVDFPIDPCLGHITCAR